MTTTDPASTPPLLSKSQGGTPRAGPTLRAQFLWVLLPLVLGPLVAVAILLFRQVRMDAHAHVLNQLTALSKLKERQIRDWAIGRQGDMAHLAAAPDVARAAASLCSESRSPRQRTEAGALLVPRFEAYLRDLNNRDFSALLLARADTGEVVLSTENARTLVGRAFADDPYFRAARSGPVLVPPRHDPRLDPTLLKIVAEAPVLDSAGHAVAVIMGIIPDSRLEVLVEPIPGLGSTGHAYVVTPDGYELGSIVGPTCPRPDNVGIRRAIGAHEGGSDEYLGSRGQQVVGIYNWLDNQDLALLVEQDASEAYASLSHAGALFGFTTAVAVVFSVMGILIVTRRLTRPIQRLTEGALAIAGGNLDVTVPVRRYDEIGLLAHAFNSMARQVREVLGSLEQRVAERKRAEDELRDHRDHLEELVEERTAQLAMEKEKAEVANKAKSVFVASVSHELRTPLNAILGYTQILQRDPSVGPTQGSALATIRESGEYLLVLINDILDLSRMEAGKLDLSAEPVSLPSLLRMVADMMRVRAEQKGLSFVFETRGLPAVVRADERRLRQVLLNLLGNAVKFTDAGEVVLRVAGEVEPPAGSVADCAQPGSPRLRFEVADTGIGMTPEQMSRIFRSFEQVAEVRRREGGTGLGLTISRELVRLMGGDLQVRSEAGRGSSFWFDLELPTTSEGVALPAPRQVVIRCEGPRKRILVVDDSEVNRLMLIEPLRGLGFEVLQAADGEQGLEMARHHGPDLILMDVMMPVMDGLEATRLLRRTPGFEQVPVLTVSASASSGDEERSKAAGATAFIAKPVVLDTLLEMICELLGLKAVHGPVGERTAGRLAPEPLVHPPPEQMVGLRDAAWRGNMRDVCLWAEQLASLGEQYRPFAEQVSQMAHQCRARALLALAEQRVGPTPPPDQPSSHTR